MTLLQLYLFSLYLFLTNIFASQIQAVTALKRRKLISLVTRKSYSIVRGPSYSSTRVKRAADLTKEMLDSGKWKETPFKEYNFKTLGESVGGGYLHPLLKVKLNAL